MGQSELNLWQRAASASVGALLTSLLVTPLDVVKTRLQAQAKQLECMEARSPTRCMRCTHYEFSNGLMDVMLPKSSNPTLYECPHHFNNTVDALHKITKYEGISGLYNGLRPSLIMAVPSTVLYFSCYDYLRNTFSEEHGMNPTLAPLVAGSSSRTIAATVISPLELIRTKMQATTSPQSMMTLVSNQVKNHGVRSLWQGLSPTLFRDVPFSAIYWVCVERCKVAVRPYVTKKSDELYGPMHPIKEFGVSFIAGATGGMIAATLTNPFDVVKTRRQVFQYSRDLPPASILEESSSLRIMQRIFTAEGMSGFFIGLAPRLAKIVPACAIMLSSYEAGKSFFLVQDFDDLTGSLEQRPW